MEAQLSPQSSDDSMYDRYIRDHNEVEMEQRGFCFVVSGIIPDEALVSSPSVEKDALDRLASPESPKYLTPADRREEWQQLMEDKFNLDVLVLLRHFGTTKGRTIRQGPIIHNLAPSTTGTRLRRAHPCREGVSIWRPVRGGLGPENGLFKVYPGSHNIKTEDELRNSNINAVEIRLRADQVLIALGGLWIEEGGGDGLLMWMGLSADIIGLHIDKYCLTFVAIAHGAERLLLLDRPPEMDPSFAPDPSSPVRRQLGQPGQRSGAANGLLDRASTSLSEGITKFIKELLDPTGLVFHAANGQMVAFLAVGRRISPKEWFLRVIIIRYLTQCCLLSGGTTKDFVRKQGLPDTAENAILNGHKIYWLEKTLEKPGIWVVLMGVFSRLTHLPTRELSSIPDLIRQHEDILVKASEWSWLMNACGQLYSALMYANCG